jgi:predicted  nucleic acid-binding Zn-ribbon protein
MNKDAYLKAVGSRIERMERQIEELRARSETLDDEDRSLYAEQVELLQRHEDLVRRKVDAARAAGEGEWSRLREGLDEACDDFQKSIEKTFLVLRDLPE